MVQVSSRRPLAKLFVPVSTRIDHSSRNSIPNHLRGLRVGPRSSSVSIPRLHPVCLGLLFPFWGIVSAAAKFLQYVIGAKQALPDCPEVIQAAILSPIVYGLGSFIFGLLSAIVFNFTANWYGGLIVETDEKRE